MNRHILVWGFAFVWELWDYFFLEWDMLSFLSNLEIYLGMAIIYVEKVILLYIFIYLYKRFVEPCKGETKDA